MHSSSFVANILIFFLCLMPAAAQNGTEAHKNAAGAANEAKSPIERAWELLDKGVASNSAETRRIAVGALGVVINNPHVIRIAEKSLHDSNAQVRAAAATALGKMHARASIPLLVAALDDNEPEVVLADAQR